MVVSERTLTWALRFYPPLLCQRVWIKKFHSNFRGADVKISRSLLNTNYNKSIFGGTIFSAADPFYAVCFDQIFQRKGMKVRVWLKSAEINYLKPGRTNLYYSIHISDDEILEAEQALKTLGKFVKSYPINIYNKQQELCATVKNEVYLRNLFSGEQGKVAY